ncbi:hypothetical protein PCO31010_00808 [Pandoraea commovens]|uniref:Uncharacterized protein n=2 Tax=Pandoraea commovens TaxID=2508289 RepID=A0A5E4SIP9_9BURK|nr:hypothetical protein PCO31010_00808 [Pandoraea commovens]
MPLDALLFTIVMRLAEGLHIGRIKSQSIISAMSNDVIANRPERLSDAALRACNNNLGRRQSQHDEITQTEHTVRMLSKVQRSKALPVSSVSARSASSLSCSPGRRLNDGRARFQRRESRSKCSQSGHERNARNRRSGAG